ncbi:hypothetical protein Y1Q_0006309 [Alligator mississippiensis]|uniref:ZP domain-containing protein n=1 Tax=Alligator mississippiensis TaxID=8496 RepID=A0A151NXB8_ALLMI|nr:hypothetical protein Y1Q_0006309 [Alligator mississippiensis]
MPATTTLPLLPGSWPHSSGHNSTMAAGGFVGSGRHHWHSPPAWSPPSRRTTPSTEDVICKAINCTSRVPAAGLENNSTAPCQLEGEAALFPASPVSFSLRLSHCCWSQTRLLSEEKNYSVQFKVAMVYTLGTRSDTALGNSSPQTPLLPVLRVPQNCATLYNLSIWDQDGDVVRCRYGLREELGCAFCKKSPFLHLDEEGCTLMYDGTGSKGMYPVELMAEDFPRKMVVLKSRARMQEIHPYNASGGEWIEALSSVPLQFTLIVDKPVEDCPFGIRRPMFISPTPDNGDRINVLPYEDVSFTVTSVSAGERMADLQVLGPHGLHMSGLWMADDLHTVSANVTWESRNANRPRRISVCFVATTLSGLQSELRCIWIVHKSADSPLGTVLLCLEDRMQLSVPRSSLGDVQESDLQRSNPECLVSSNSTHLLVEIPLVGGGTREQGNPSFFTFTNRIVSQHRGVSAPAFKKTLAIPVSCKYQQEETGSTYCPFASLEDQGFGNVSFDIRFSRKTSDGMRLLKRGASINASVNDQLFISVSAKSDLADAHLIVQSCQVLGNQDSSSGFFIIQQGCLNYKAAKEVSLEDSKDKVYSLRLASIADVVSEVFVTCDVKLCCSPSKFRLCSSGCKSFKSQNALSKMLETKIYQISAGPIRISKSPSSGTNHTALVVGVVLGCTVMCVVFLLVKKSFVGVPHRNVSLRT